MPAPQPIRQTCCRIHVRSAAAVSASHGHSCRCSSDDRRTEAETFSRLPTVLPPLTTESAKADNCPDTCPVTAQEKPRVVRLFLRRTIPVHLVPALLQAMPVTIPGGRQGTVRFSRPLRCLRSWIRRCGIVLPFVRLAPIKPCKPFPSSQSTIHRCLSAEAFGCHHVVATQWTVEHDDLPSHPIPVPYRTPRNPRILMHIHPALIRFLRSSRATSPRDVCRVRFT